VEHFGTWTLFGGKQADCPVDRSWVTSPVQLQEIQEYIEKALGKKDSADPFEVIPPPLPSCQCHHGPSGAVFTSRHTRGGGVGGGGGRCMLPILTFYSHVSLLCGAGNES